MADLDAAAVVVVDLGVDAGVDVGVDAGVDAGAVLDADGLVVAAEDPEGAAAGGLAEAAGAPEAAAVGPAAEVAWLVEEVVVEEDLAVESGVGLAAVEEPELAAGASRRPEAPRASAQLRRVVVRILEA